LQQKSFTFTLQTTNAASGLSAANHNKQGLVSTDELQRPAAVVTRTWFYCAAVIQLLVLVPCVRLSIKRF